MIIALLVAILTLLPVHHLRAQAFEFVSDVYRSIGDARSSYVVGNRLYINADGVVAIYDLSDPLDIKLTNKYSSIGNLNFPDQVPIITHGNELQLCDLSDPDEIEFQYSSFSPYAEVIEVEIIDDYLIAKTYEEYRYNPPYDDQYYTKLTVFDISNLNNVYRVYSSTISRRQNPEYELFVTGDYLVYSGWDEVTLSMSTVVRRLNYRDGSLPVIQRFQFSDELLGTHVYLDYLVMLFKDAEDGTQYIRIFHTDYLPYSLTRVTDIEVPKLASWSAYENNIFVTNYTDKGFYTSQYDITDVEYPELIADTIGVTQHLGSSTNHQLEIKIVDSLAVISYRDIDGSLLIGVWNCADSGEFVPIKPVLNEFHKFRDVASSLNHAYLLEYPDIMSIVDVGDGSYPVAIDNIRLPGTGMAIVGGNGVCAVLYSPDNSDPLVRIYDCTNPAEPVEINTYETNIPTEAGGDEFRLRMFENYIVWRTDIPDTQWEYLAIMDVTDSDNPRLLDSLLLPVKPPYQSGYSFTDWGYAIKDGWLYAHVNIFFGGWCIASIQLSNQNSNYVWAGFLDDGEIISDNFQDYEFFTIDDKLYTYQRSIDAGPPEEHHLLTRAFDISDPANISQVDIQDEYIFRSSQSPYFIKCEECNHKTVSLHTIRPTKGLETLYPGNNGSLIRQNLSRFPGVIYDFTFDHENGNQLLYLVRDGFLEIYNLPEYLLQVNDPPGIHGEQDTRMHPVDFHICAISPNPFNNRTEITFDMVERGKVDLTVYDLSGRLISQILNQATFASGTHHVSWGPLNLPTGQYLLELRWKDQRHTRTLTILK
ncbi:T9SS type A sorting domain-containing protein [Calditrichota bacterium]